MRIALGALASLAAVALGLQLLSTRFGLTQEFYPNQREVRGEPVISRTDGELALDKRKVRRFVRAHVFTVRWRGSIRIPKPGAYRFSTLGAGASSLSINGETIVSNAGGARPERAWARTRLKAGVHPIEVIHQYAGHGERTFDVLWKPPGTARGPIPAERLFSGRPGALGRAVRSAVGGLSFAQRKGLGTLLFLAGVVPVLFILRRRRRLLPKLWIPDALRRRWTPRHTVAAAALALFLASFLGTLPLGGSPYGFDDTRYMDVAEFLRPVNWMTNRYAHVYLLKGFTALAGGDPFAGSELYWSFAFAVTVVCMFLTLRALGPRYQFPTFMVAVLLLFSQRMFFRHIGGAFADLSAMLFVMVGTALFAIGWSRRWPRGGRWYAFGIGLVTVWASKSKELGAVLLYLLPLLAFHEGRLALGRFSQSQRIHELHVEDGEMEFGEAEAAEQSEMSFQYRFKRGPVLRFDAYYRELTHLRPRYENLYEPIELFPETTEDRVEILPDSARLRGLGVRSIHRKKEYGLRIILC